MPRRRTRPDPRPPRRSDGRPTTRSARRTAGATVQVTFLAALVFALPAAAVAGDALEPTEAASALPFTTPLPDDALVRVDFADAPLLDVARWVAVVTGRNLMVAPGALDDATITVVSPRPVPAGDVWPLFIAALSAHGLTVQDRGSYVRIIEASAR